MSFGDFWGVALHGAYRRGGPACGGAHSHGGPGRVLLPGVGGTSLSMSSSTGGSGRDWRSGSFVGDFWLLPQEGPMSQAVDGCKSGWAAHSATLVKEVSRKTEAWYKAHMAWSCGAGVIRATSPFPRNRVRLALTRSGSPPA